VLAEVREKEAMGAGPASLDGVQHIDGAELEAEVSCDSETHRFGARLWKRRIQCCPRW
jgi:hypothetical protein